jgi:hypothetical protein
MKPRLIDTLILLVLAAVSLSACAGLPFTGGSSWREEVLLHDGRTLIVERSIVRRGRHEIGQSPPIGEQTIRFIMPDTHQTITWKDQYSEDLGMANFLPLALDIHHGVAYLIANPMGCLSYNKWGRPNPPHVVFKYNKNEWQRIPMEELPAEIKMPNLISSAPDVEVEKSGKRFMSAEMIKKIRMGYKQPDNRTILREPTTGGNTGCMVMVRYRGHWIWDKDPIARKSIDIEIINKNRKNTPDQGKPDSQAPEKATP